MVRVQKVRGSVGNPLRRGARQRSSNPEGRERPSRRLLRITLTYDVGVCISGVTLDAEIQPTLNGSRILLPLLRTFHSLVEKDVATSKISTSETSCSRKERTLHLL